MATSGTTSFTLDVADIIEEAYERIGSESRTGYAIKTARRSLNLMMLEWQNRGLNLWTVKRGTESMVAGTAAYTLTGEKLDIIEAFCRSGSGSSQVDYSMERISVSSYSQLANKNTQGRPTQFYVERVPGSITVNLWPVPDSSAYTFGYYYMERIDDTGTSGTYTIDVPDRYLPALVSGLAYNLALKDIEKAPLAPGLKQIYEEHWQLASEAAREKASIFLRPEVGYI
jgi:hypothetical protein